MSHHSQPAFEEAGPDTPELTSPERTSPELTSAPPAPAAEPAFPAAPAAPDLSYAWEKTVRIGEEEVLIRGIAPEEATSTDALSEPSGRNRSRPTQTSRRSAKPAPAHEAGSAPRRPDITPLPPAGNLQMLLRRTGDKYQGVLLEGSTVVEHYVERPENTSIVGNIYVGVITAVVASLEAVFVDIGTGSHGILRLKDGVASAKVGDKVMVRVVKDSFGHKGPKLKADLSLTGRYVVLLPSAPGKIAVSRHLSHAERSELRTRLASLANDSFGLIARSNATTASSAELEADLAALRAQWAEIAAIDVAAASGPTLVYSEPTLPVRLLREHFTSGYKRCITNDPEIYAEARAYLAASAPHLVNKVMLHTEEADLFTRFHVFDQLRRSLERKVYLPSGGHLVFDRTEALTAIDVNTGRFAGGESHEETVYLNNLEAASAIAHQIRLRDIGGLIVIDFVDMVDPAHRDAVLGLFRSAMARDRTTSDVFTISELGLVEMSRKRRSNTFLESVSTECSHCHGRGVEVSVDEDLLAPSQVPVSASPAADNGHETPPSTDPPTPAPDPSSPAESNGPFPEHHSSENNSGSERPSSDRPGRSRRRRRNRSSSRK